MPQYNASEFLDVFTVLQDVGRGVIDGLVYDAPKSGMRLNMTVVGFEAGVDSSQNQEYFYQNDELIYSYNHFDVPKISFEVFDVEEVTFREEYIYNDIDTFGFNVEHNSDIFVDGLSGFLFVDDVPYIPLLSDVGFNKVGGNVLDDTDYAYDIATPVESGGGNVEENTPKADTPSLAVEAVHVIEDHEIKLDIRTSLNDIDGQEMLQIQISDVPDGAVLSAGTDFGNGTWRLSLDDLSDLVIDMPEHYSGEFSLVVTAISTEVTGAISQVTSVLDVVVDPIVDAPHLSVTESYGYEDTSIHLNISAGLVDQDGSEMLSLVSISGVPEGAVLSAGQQGDDGSYKLTLGDLDGLSITPPLHSNEDFTLSVEVTSTEIDGVALTTQVNLPVNVIGVGDVPIANVSFGGFRGLGEHVINSTNVHEVDQGFLVTARNINEDGTLSLASTDNVGIGGSQGFGASGDTDNAWVDAETGWNPVLAVSEELIIEFDSLVIDAKAEFGYFYRDWTGGIENGTVTGYRDGQEIGRIDFSAPEDRAININFMDQAFDQLVFEALPYSNVDEVNPSHAKIDSSDFTIKSLSYTSVEEIPSDVVVTDEDVSVEIGHGLSGQLVDSDGSEVMGYVISDVPVGAVLSKGLDNGDGTYSLTEDDLGGLIFHPPENFSGNIQLIFTVITTENDGDQSFDSALFNVQVNAVADAPNLNVVTTLAVEDVPVDIDISGSLVDVDGSESLVFIISNVPDGVRINHGSLNSDGSYTLLAEELEGLQVILPPNSNDDFQLQVEALSIDDNGNQASSVKFVNIDITGVADEVVVDVMDAYGEEDTPIDIDVTINPFDLDGSESFSYTISDVPVGAEFSVGVNEGDGLWSFTAEDLAYLSFISPEHFSGDIDMALTAIAIESDGDVASSSGEFYVHVDAVADTPELSVSQTSFEVEAGESVLLDINANLVDLDGSETLSVKASDVPDEISFSSGVSEGKGVWVFSDVDLDGLEVQTEFGYEGSLSFHIQAQATETVGGDIAVSEASEVFFLLNTTELSSFEVTSDWVDGCDDDSALAPSSNDWVHGVEEDGGSDDIQGGDAIGDLVYSSQNDGADNGLLQDQPDGGLIS